MADYTPMMRQYFEIKEQYKDTILMFRLGDFYEMFFDDAKLVSSELELVLTGRDCGQAQRAPMCGVPFHSVDSYIARLIAKGYKVAICEQVEDPAQAKGIVRRDVVRVITPGTVIESAMLDESTNNYLCCIVMDKSAAGLCFVDVSTGAFHVTQFCGNDMSERIINEIGRFSPSEILYSSEVARCKKVRDFIKNSTLASGELIPDEALDLEKLSNVILSHFKAKNLSDLKLEECTQAVLAAGETLGYLKRVQKNDLQNITEIDFYADAKFMNLNVSSRRNLELVETMRGREKKGTLLWVLDKTKTAMGKRMLKNWVEQPLTGIAQITRRHNAVQELVDSHSVCEELKAFMSGISDMERLITRIVYASANARELLTLAQTLQKLPAIKEILAPCQSAYLQQLCNDIDPSADVRELILASIRQDAPLTLREGGMINDKFNEELDDLRALVSNGKEYIAGIQSREQEKTGIKKLKIGYNRVFGYYIEILNTYKELVPEDYIRKQTLTNCERYITQELKDLEAKVLGAQDRIVKLEYELFTQIRNKIAEAHHTIQKTAMAISQVDVLCSFASVAYNNRYVCPVIRSDSVIDIRQSRHPVVELMLDGAPFVPNDVTLDCADNRCMVITGPNMAGKSTYMRQVALIVLMAQIGSFVPADYAEIGIVDSIFTRVGASDDLASGQSTFMVEMSEVASILSNATQKSLIIFDEIGRGTSTFDGMSIARAVLEYCADKKKLGAKTLFATHYHELTELEQTTSGIKNYNVAVKKRGDDITFLRKIVRGGADGSYGIEVAKLAGIPSTVVNRAKTVLKEIENTDYTQPPHSKTAKPVDDDQVTFESQGNQELVDEIKMIDINTYTPIEALTKLHEIVNKAQNN